MLSTNCPLCRYPKDSDFDHNLHGCPNKKLFGWTEVKYDRTKDTRRPEEVRKAEKLRKENERDVDYSARRKNQEKEAAAKKEKDEKARLAKDTVVGKNGNDAKTEAESNQENAPIEADIWKRHKKQVIDQRRFVS